MVFLKMSKLVQTRSRLPRAVLLGLLALHLGCKPAASPSAAAPARKATRLLLPSPAVPAAESATRTTVDQDGMQLSVGFSAPAGQGLRAYSRVQAEVELRDAGAHTGALSGRQPLLWLVKREDGRALVDRETCKRAIRDVLGGATALRPAAHFNHFELLTLDDNPSVSIQDPQIATSNTRTLGQLTLAGPAADGVSLGRDAIVTVPDHGQVVRLSVESRTTAAYQVGGHPYDIEALPGGGGVVVGDAEGDALTWVDLSRGVTDGAAVTRVTIGAGPHRLALGQSGHTVAVTVDHRASVALVDTVTHAVKGRFPLRKPIAALAWSDLAQSAYGLTDDGALYRAQDGTGQPELLSAPRGKGVDLTASPDGRWLVLLRDAPPVLELLDTASQKLVFTSPVGPRPVRLVRSPTMVLVAHADRADMESFDVKTFDPARPSGVLRITMGTKGFPAGVLAPWLAPAPGAEGLFVLQPADRNVLLWNEGMAAPAGSSPLYPWTARGVLASDQSLVERAPGSYRTEGMLPGAGDYVAVMLATGAPQLYSCTPLHVAPDSEQRDLRRVRARLLDSPAVAGQPASLRIHLEALDGKPVRADDVVVSTVQLPDFQDRQLARFERDGDALVTLTPAHAGPHEVVVTSTQLDLTDDKGLVLRWDVAASATAPASPVVSSPSAPAPTAAADSAQRKPTLPDVTLTDQDGRKLRFWSDVVKGKLVFFNSFFTSCGGTCPVQSSVFSALQKRLGDRVGKDIVLVSVTVDPENDTPEVLKAYAKKYGAGPGWYFLTGSEADVEQVLVAMDLYAKRPDDHSPMAAVGDERSMLWRKVLNLKAPAALEAELKALERDVALRQPAKP